MKIKCPKCQKAIMQSSPNSPDDPAQAVMTCNGCGAEMTEKEYLQSCLPPGQQPSPASYQHFFERELEEEE